MNEARDIAAAVVGMVVKRWRAAFGKARVTQPEVAVHARVIDPRDVAMPLALRT